MTGSPVPTVLLADDHPLFREGLAALLGSRDDVRVVGTAVDGREAVRRVHETDPDVVLMDVSMPVLDGLAATRELADSGSRAAVVVLTMATDDDTVFSALRAGARGFLLKEAGQDEVVRAIATAAVGGVVFGATLADRVGRFFASGPVTRTGAETFPQLTNREREVLDLLAAGRDNTAIAQALFLSPKTVRNQVSNVLAKLQVADRREAAALAQRAGRTAE